MNTIFCVAAVQGFSKVAKNMYHEDKKRVAFTVVFCLHVFIQLPWQASWDAARNDADLAPFLPEGEMSVADQQQARRVGKKFLLEASVKTKAHEKHLNTHKLLSAITEMEAKNASMLLKTGYHEYTPTRHGHYDVEHHYYTTLKEAMAKCPQLKNIYDKYDVLCDDVTPQQFMEALYKYDPMLRTRRIHIKYALSDELKGERANKAKILCDRAQREADFLQRLFFVDECGIILDHELRKGTHVYCDAHDKAYRFVIPFQKLNPNKQIKIKIMGAVNMLTGPVFLEFTTGTTDCKRLHNKNPDGTERTYIVSVLCSMLLLAKDNNAPGRAHNTSRGQPACQHVCVGHHAASLIDAYCVVCWAEHNTQATSNNLAGWCQEPIAQAALQLQVVHPDHTHTRLNCFHTAAHILIQHTPAAHIKGVIEVARAISLHDGFLACVHKINRGSPKPWGCLAAPLLTQLRAHQLAH